jgi:hypothetical protein
MGHILSRSTSGVLAALRATSASVSAAPLAPPVNRPRTPRAAARPPNACEPAGCGGGTRSPRPRAGLAFHPYAPSSLPVPAYLLDDAPSPASRSVWSDLRKDAGAPAGAVASVSPETMARTTSRSERRPHGGDAHRPKRTIPRAGRVRCDRGRMRRRSGERPPRRPRRRQRLRSPSSRARSTARSRVVASSLR